MTPFFHQLVADFARPLESARGIAMLAFTLTGIALVIWGSFVRTMVPLRALTVGSNVLLIVGAVLAVDPANLVLNIVLLPINSWRLMEIRRITRQVEAAASRGDLSGLWLRPYMSTARLRAGAVLFRQGDAADTIHLLAQGDLELVEIGKKVAPGEIFGEISMFSPDRRRTLTALCRTPCVVLTIREDVFRQLYFQEPKFAFQVSNLIAHRLGADIQRLRKELEAVKAAAAAAAPAAQTA